MCAGFLPDRKNDGSGVWKRLWPDAIGQQSNGLFVLPDLMLRRRIAAGHDDELLEAGPSKRKAEQDMFVYGIKTLRLRRGQLQHHVNGFYPLCIELPSGLCNETIRDLQQSAHLHLAYTSAGHAHGIIERRKGKDLLQQRGKLPLLRAAEFFQDRQQIFLLFRQQHQPRPFPGGERSELRYGSTSRSLSVSVMQL